ncbi:MAG: NADH-quinone oxidoreductase subunit M [Helicobacteraceae bacterium]|jgi:NADH-quinone oxidoreductase subunit M|nr:NADH-quinone oxidoreductase subunit M [Helicobacteraceae bacterium]
MSSYLLSVLIFFPMLGAFACFAIPKERVRIAALAIATIEFALALALWYLFDDNYEFVNETLGMQFVYTLPIIESLGISYKVGVDGISLFLIVLSAFITLIALIALGPTERLKNLVASILLLEMTMIGVFAALDAIVFYFFWEFSLVPMLYIIGAWGSGNRIYAAIKFFIYTFSGSLLLLLGILYFAWICYQDLGVLTFDIVQWHRHPIAYSQQIWLFVAMGIGFAVKVPMFPFHTWLPYAHGQAPTIGSVLLAAVLLKMGTYGFVRFSLPLFPAASVYFAPVMGAIGIIMVIYAAMVAFAQKDIKQIIAYSSISHMGVIILGTFALNTEGIGGSVFFMLSHGIISGALFMLVGVIYDRRHTKALSEFGGIASVMPIYSAIFMFMAMASAGLPLTMGFVGEFLSLLGYFRASPIMTLLAGTSIILGAVYMLNLYRKTFYGAVTIEANKSLTDLNKRELAALIPLVLVVIWLGVYPKPVLAPINKASAHLAEMMIVKSTINQDLAKERLERLNSPMFGGR